MIHAYRLLYPDSRPAPEMLWEWEEPYITRLLWNANTFERTVVQCTFLHWHAFAAANQRIWETSYRLRPSHEPWDPRMQPIAPQPALPSTSPPAGVQRMP